MRLFAAILTSILVFGSLTVAETAWAEAAAKKGADQARSQQSRQSSLNAGVCDELADATPGLQGLCVAFCESQDCVPDMTLENPLENCSASARRLLDNYRAKQGAGDPDMPCVKQPDTSPECPCWTITELDALRMSNGVGETAACFSNAAFGSSHADLDYWLIQNRSAGYETWVISSGMSSEAGGPVCWLIDSCQDGACLQESRVLPVTAAQHQACSADVAISAMNRGLICSDASL